MPLDSQDYEMMKSIRNAIRDGNDMTARLLRQMNDRQEKSQADVAAAFDRVAQRLGELAGEVRGLRSDLSPTLEKRKLAAPGGNGA